MQWRKKASPARPLRRWRILPVLLPVLLWAAGCAQASPGNNGVVQSPPRCAEVRDYDETGKASWYGSFHHGRRTASGQVFDMNGLTAAHRWLPFGTKIRVTNERNGRSVVLTVNDRGPFVAGRVLDVSRRAARELDFIKAGIAPVRIEAGAAC